MSDVASFFAHHGVKGMKWGVRKNYQELRSQTTERVTLTTEKGATVTLQEVRVTRLGAGLGAISARVRNSLNASRSFNIEVGGKQVGEVSIKENDKDTVNFAWVGVKPKERGKGYASTVFDAGIAYSKQKGYSKVTLEVPGNAPDARHIYEKRGFKPTGKTWGNPNDIWGGLTELEYQIP